MKRLIILIAVVVTLGACGEIKEQIEDINSRLDRLENTSIATINQQVSSINTSISLLQDTDKELKGYITNLQGSLSELQRSLNTTNEKIDAVKKDLEQHISTAKTEVLAELESVRAALQGEINTINETLTLLQQKDQDLETRISELKAYVDGLNQDTRNWASATFSTLQQYEKLSNDIALIRELITGINTSMGELETRVNNKITQDIAAAVTAAKQEMQAAYEQAIQAAIIASEKSMKEWVNTQLTGYYTIAEADAKAEAMQITINQSLTLQRESLDSLATAMAAEQKRVIDSLGDLLSGEMAAQFAARDQEINTIKTNVQLLDTRITKNIESIDSLKLALDGAKQEITAAYTAAINTAVNDLEGKIDDITEAKVVAVNKAIVDGINARLDALESDMETAKSDIITLFSNISTINGRLDTLRGDVNNILASVQSIAVIPDYSDGSVKLLKTSPTENVYRFEILPKTAAQRLVSLGKSVFTFKAVYTEQTRATVGDFFTLPISQVKYENDLVVVTVDASSIHDSTYYWKSGISISGRLSVTNDCTDRSSSFFVMTPTVPGAVDIGLSVFWAIANLGASVPSGAGDMYCWGSPKPYVNGDGYFTNPSSLSSINGTEYDASTQTLGPGWETPTENDWVDLFNKCQRMFDDWSNVLTMIGPNGKRIQFYYVTGGVSYLTSSANNISNKYYYMAWNHSNNKYISNSAPYNSTTYRIRPIYR